MISSHGQDQIAQSNQGNDIVITLEKSLSLDGRSSGEACHTNECGSLDDPSDKEFARLKVRLRLHDEEVHFPPGAMAAEPLIDAKTGQAVHQVDPVSDERPALGKRLFRTVAFGVTASVLVGATFAWQFYGDDQSKLMVGAGKRHGIVASTKPRAPTSYQLNWLPKRQIAYPLRIQPFYKRRLPFRPHKCRSRPDRLLSCNTSLRPW